VQDGETDEGMGRSDMEMVGEGEREVEVVVGTSKETSTFAVPDADSKSDIFHCKDTVCCWC
jgi:hypothetical protein